MALVNKWLQVVVTLSHIHIARDEICIEPYGLEIHLQLVQYESLMLVLQQ